MIEISKIIEKNIFFKNLFYFFFDFYLTLIRKIYSSFPFRNENIAIIALHKLGDSVFTIPAIKVIIRNHEKNKIAIVCFPETKPIYELIFPALDYIIIKHDELLWDNRIVKKSACRKVKDFQPSIIYDLTGIAFLIFKVRAKEIIGLSKRQFKSVYDVYSPIREKPHIIDIYLDVIKKKINIDNLEEIKNFPVSFNYSNRKILIHPFAGWEAKEWGIRKFLELIVLLNKNYECILVTNGLILEEHLLSFIKSNDIKIIDTSTTDELIYNIQDCSVFIGNDSGPAYIASLLGKPSFIIYGPTNPSFHLPYGDYHGYIQKQIKCSPAAEQKLCFTNGGRNGCPSFECMLQLSVEEVYNSVMHFLEKNKFNKHEISGND